MFRWLVRQYMPKTERKPVYKVLRRIALSDRAYIVLYTTNHGCISPKQLGEYYLFINLPNSKMKGIVLACKLLWLTYQQY